MSTTSLTRKYRPQRFGEVAGQEAVKRILSRAAGEDKVAPAYLFSGTRGVGKTTLARIFAKALNCETAPTGEPCNACAQCRQITSGVSPDVIEIDAATHGGVDEARRLKEDVGYAPLQSRYKVFIIDEAHMLSKAAFNALLKTLEEPPGRVTFVLATTEPHKFPATIISRCQHFIFKRMTQAELEGHLTHILERENIGFERGAVSLIARRGAGSVRDSMSLMGQTLALGESELTEADVRGVLGLAGQEVFFGLIAAIHGQDCAGVADILRQVLDRGLDIGFFLRELAGAWRNMFLLRQAGEAGFPLVDVSREEASEWLEWARKYDLAHIHACWQLTLEGQRRVMTSLEPALALELLLLNLAYLPQLLSLDNLSAAAQTSRGTGGGPARSSGAPGPSGSRPSTGYGSRGQDGARRGWSPPRETGAAPEASPGPSGQGAWASQGRDVPAGQGPAGRTAPPAAGAMPPGYAPPSRQDAPGAMPPGYVPSPRQAGQGVAMSGATQNAPAPHGPPGYGPSGHHYGRETAPLGAGARPGQAATPKEPETPPRSEEPEPGRAQLVEPAEPAPSARPAEPTEPAVSAGSVEPVSSAGPAEPGFTARGPQTWEGFLAFYAQKRSEGFAALGGLETVKGAFRTEENLLELRFSSGFLRDRMQKPDSFTPLIGLVREYFGPSADVRLARADASVKRQGKDELKAYVNARPEVREAVAKFGAEVLDSIPRRHGAQSEE